jgi:hypothetical protein
MPMPAAAVIAITPTAITNSTSVNPRSRSALALSTK